MSIEKDIRIIDLLAQREAEFMKVHALEEAVRSLLGGAAFPFPEVRADLPSRHPRRAASAAAEKASGVLPESAAGIPCDGFRPLQKPRENCYHIFYVDENGQHQESFQNDSQLLEEILCLQSDEFRVTGIETVFFESPDNWQAVELICGRTGETE